MKEIRLIDANALKENVKVLPTIGDYAKGEIIEVIDNAPTVNKFYDYNEGYKDGFSLGFKRGSESNERPQGEWEEPFENNGKTYHKCNHCHISSELILIDKFCPNCGADMRKKFQTPSCLTNPERQAELLERYKEE